MYWEDLYNASSPDTKVILTVRDDENAWWNSWLKFMSVTYDRDAVGDLNLARIFDSVAARGLLGPMSQRMGQILDLATRHGGIHVEPNYSGEIKLLRTIYELS